MPKRMLPNMVTLANLICGFISLWLTMDAYYKEAAAVILLAMILDGLDGRLARRFDVTSDFGRELDSLSDLVSFGVAPALLVYARVLVYFKYWGLVLAIIFALCGAVRLARYNVLQTDDYFLGVPITFAGSLLAFLVLLVQHLPLYVYPGMMIMLAFLMVSRLKIPRY